MLLTLETAGNEIRSFTDLYKHAVELLTLHTMDGLEKTVVFGPATPTNHTTLEENLAKLYDHSVSLSNNGWCVLELASFQPVINKLILQLGRDDYPVEILNEFTFPLIKNGCFDTLHFRKSYPDSYGASAKYIVAKHVDIPIIYVS